MPRLVKLTGAPTAGSLRFRLNTASPRTKSSGVTPTRTPAPAIRPRLVPHGMPLGHGGEWYLVDAPPTLKCAQLLGPTGMLYSSDPERDRTLTLLSTIW